MSSCTRQPSSPARDQQTNVDEASSQISETTVILFISSKSSKPTNVGLNRSDNMRTGEAHITIGAADVEGTADGVARNTFEDVERVALRIALLTPYSGNNLGDAAIQDAIIANIRPRFPNAAFSGISLNCANFLERHGTNAFPLHATNRPYCGMSDQEKLETTGSAERTPQGSDQGKVRLMPIRNVLSRVPLLGWCLKKIYLGGKVVWGEGRHAVEAYRFLRAHDLLVVSGGGQLDDEWGGPWGHPFALFKWSVLARIARIPCGIASVGVGKVTSIKSRWFLSAALRMARYRSYREKNTRKAAASLLPQAEADSVIPDLALSLRDSQLPEPAGLRSIAQGRMIVAVGPMAYAKPGSWPYKNRALYDRYLQEMSRVVMQLLEHGCFVVIVYSALSDRIVITELIERLPDEAKRKMTSQMYVPAIATWRDLVALLRDVDCLIASRLHSVIFGFLARKPTLAISFDPKVDWVMQDLGQTDYLLQIRDFSAEDVVRALRRLELRKHFVTEQIRSYQERTYSAAARQYDLLAGLALAHHRLRPAPLSTQ
jgi:polysaccharide pyruvyl transferase WcaK-like protein